jgi:hypothetical protein
VLDDAICDARAWILFTLVLLTIVVVFLIALLFVGLLIQFAVREIRRKALDIMRTPPKICVPGEKAERTVTWQQKT